MQTSSPNLISTYLGKLLPSALGIEDYGSDSENDSGNETTTTGPATRSGIVPGVTLSASLPPTSSASNTLLPHVKRSAKKITIGIPRLSTIKHDGVDGTEDERPVAKRPRLEAGAGISSLTSMLPAPKQKITHATPPERVLGAGRGKGLIFNTSRPPASQDQTSASGDYGDLKQEMLQPAEDQFPVPVTDTAATLLPFLPLSVGNKRPNISVDEKPDSQAVAQRIKAPVVDFFSLGMKAFTFALT